MVFCHYLCGEFIDTFHDMKTYSTLLAAVKISWLLITLSSVVFLSGCARQVNPGGDGGNPESGVGSFDFSTTTNLPLSVNYDLNYPVLFEVYTENPIITNEFGETKNDLLEPVFRAVTDQKGRFDGEFNVPTMCQEFFLYTKYIGAPTVVKMSFDASGVSFDVLSKKASRSSSLWRADQPVGDLKTLGSWNTNGYPDYLLSRKQLDGALINSIMYSLPEGQRLGVGGTGDPNGLISDQAIGDLHVVKNTKVNLVFMHEGASMRNVLAYYCYDAKNPPADKNELVRIVAFPNTSYAYSGGELSSGDRVQLKYWNGTELVDEFPAGTVIGWCMLASSFNEGKINTNPIGVYYSNPLFNPETERKQHCVALRDKDNKIIALGFEDQHLDRKINGTYISDRDYNDMVYCVETEVVGGIDMGSIPELIPDPSVDPSPEENAITYRGSLAFEDLWPSKGDYDMNDVVIDYESTLYRNPRNMVVKIVDKFTPRWSGANKNSGFGYQLGIRSSSVLGVKVSSDFDESLSFFKTDAKGLELSQTQATIIVFQDIKSLLARNPIDPNKAPKSTTITIQLSSPVSLQSLTQPPYNPFIVTGTNGDAVNRGREVHLPNALPTDLADRTLLGTSNDKSSAERGFYYISDDNYMFALHLPVSFDFPSEKQRLDEAYPRFGEWAKSKGEKAKDWYMDAKK